MQPNNVPSSYTRNFLPSKKILILIGVLATAGILYWIVPKIVTYVQMHRASFSLTKKPPEPLIASGGAMPALDKDTDGDGVPDWQEALFGLDPTKVDSDNDGVNDYLPKVDGKSIADALNLSDTSKLTLAVYGAFQNTRTEDIDPAQVEQVAGQEVLDHANAIEASFKKYTKTDLNLIDTTRETVVNYSKQVITLTDLTGDPLVFAKDIQDKVLNGGDTAGITGILNSGITKLLSMNVPTILSDLHLSLINASYYLVQTLELPAGNDELNTYTKALIAQKNINLLQKTLFDITITEGVYASNQD